MAGQQDALRANRSESMARRPSIASGTSSAGTVPMGNRQFEGRRGHGNAFKLRLDRIVPDPDQPRKTFDEESLGRLARSLDTRGQLVPILVRWSEALQVYVVIEGERRLRAAQRAGMKELAVILEDETDPDSILEMQLVTNALREDVAPVEQAKAWDRLRQSQGLTYRELGDKLGYEFSTVSKALALLDLTPEIQDRVDAGEIAASTAEKIARLDPAEQGPLADRVVAEGLSRADVVEAVREVEAKASRKPRPASDASRSKGRGAKPKPATSRVWKRAGGLKLTAERSRGIDPLELAELLRSALAEIEAEQDPAADVA